MVLFYSLFHASAYCARYIDQLACLEHSCNSRAFKFDTNNTPRKEKLPYDWEQSGSESRDASVRYKGKKKKRALTSFFVPTHPFFPPSLSFFTFLLYFYIPPCSLQHVVAPLFVAPSVEDLLHLKVHLDTERDIQ